MPDREHLLAQYIQRLLDVQDQQAAGLTQADLNRVASEMGLSDADRAHVADLVTAHHERGVQHAAHQHWDEAIAELRQAVALRPLDVPLLHTLALAYQGRWQARHEEADREAALAYTRRCIQADPKHQPSYPLLTALKPARNKGKVVVLMAAIGVSVAALVGIMAWGLLSERAAPPAQEPEPTSGPSATRSTPAPLMAASPAEWAPAATLVAGPKAEGLALHVQTSSMRRYAGSYAYTFKGHLTSEAEEIHALQLTLSGKNADGTTVIQKMVDVLEGHHPYLRPGEVWGVQKLLFEKKAAPDVQQVVFTVAKIERAPAPQAYAPLKTLAASWGVPHPNLDLSFEERESHVAHNDLFNRWRHDLTLCVENTGPRAVQRLKIEVDWYDEAGAVLLTKPAWIVSSSAPPLQPTQRTAVRIFGAFDEGVPRFAQYKVRITAVQ